MTADQPQQAENKRAHWAMREVDQLLSRLARYTRFVIYSKWFLMIFALILLLVLVGLPLLSKNRSGVRMSFVDAKQTGQKAVSDPVMNKPEYYGTSDSGDQYKITGLKAVQLSPSIIQIDNVEGQLINQSGGWRSLAANEAQYQQEAKQLNLSGAVTMMDNQGYSFITESAQVDTATSEVSGAAPVEGTGPLGNLLASSFRIMDNGKRIIFYGGDAPVKLTIKREGPQKHAQ